MKEKQEIMVLGHEPWPGFRKAFLVIFALACMYLAGLLFSSFKHLDSTTPSHDRTPVSEVTAHE